MKKTIFYILTFLTLGLCPFASAHASSIGLVNFSTCITESKYGKDEQASFEQVKTQMTTLISDLEKKLQEIAGKFNDPEFVDSLSPEAEQEMKAKFQGMNEEYNHYQNQYMQVLNQANMKLIQTMNQHVNQASNVVAKKDKLSIVLREDTCFYYTDSDDITAQVIKEMDKDYDNQSNIQTTAQTTKESK